MLNKAAQYILLFLLPVFVLAGELSEEQKVFKLLQKVEDSKLIFIRNGSNHSSVKARKHLEYKYNYAIKGFWFWTSSKKVTVKDFIEKIATKSSSTGKLYYIIDKTGKKVPSGDWLKAKLKIIEASQKD